MVHFMTSGGAGVNVSYYVPKKIEFTSSSNIDGNNASLYFTGYGDKYERYTSEYTATVTSTTPSITSIEISDAHGIICLVL